MFELKFDADSFLNLYVSVHDVLCDHQEILTTLAYNTFESLIFVLEEKLLSALESECDKNG